jgi:hypothetical protein
MRIDEALITYCEQNSIRIEDAMQEEEAFWRAVHEGRFDDAGKVEDKTLDALDAKGGE